HSAAPARACGRSRARRQAAAGSLSPAVPDLVHARLARLPGRDRDLRTHDRQAAAVVISHAPIQIGGVILGEREPADLRSIGGEMADRIGCRGIAQEGEGLTTAAAEILLPPRAARAWLLHPARAAKRIEGRRLLPDIGERSLAHRPEFEAGNA